MLTQHDLGKAISALVEAIVPMAIDAAIRDGRLQVVSSPEDLSRRAMLTAKEVERHYGIKASTLAEWRSNSKGPAWHKPGKQVMYRPQDVEDYLQSRRVRSHEADKLS